MYEYAAFWWARGAVPTVAPYSRPDQDVPPDVHALQPSWLERTERTARACRAWVCDDRALRHAGFFKILVYPIANPGNLISVGFRFNRAQMRRPNPLTSCRQDFLVTVDPHHKRNIESS